MKVLVTGASGFIGRYVLDSLHRCGVEVVAVGRHAFKAYSHVQFIQSDLLKLDGAELIARSGASHLLHLAWCTEHGVYWTSPLNLQWVDATLRLVEVFCRTGGERVVVAGSCAEYDWAHGYCREDSTPLIPSTLYGAAKDSARRRVMEVCALHQVSCIWGRVFLPFGVGEDRRRLVPSLIDVFTGKRPPFGVNAEACRDFLHVSDVAEGFTALLQTGAVGAYNLSSGQPVQIAEVVRIIARLLGADPLPVLEMAGERAGESALLAGDCRKLKGLGWSPKYSLLEGLKHTIDVHSAHKGNSSS